MTIKFIEEKKHVAPVTISEMEHGFVYRHDEGHIVIRTDEGTVLILDNGYLARASFFSRDVFYPITLEVRVVEEA